VAAISVPHRAKIAKSFFMSRLLNRGSGQDVAPDRDSGSMPARRFGSAPLVEGPAEAGVARAGI